MAPSSRPNPKCGFPYCPMLDVYFSSMYTKMVGHCPTK